MRNDAKQIVLQGYFEELKRQKQKLAEVDAEQDPVTQAKEQSNIRLMIRWLEKQIDEIMRRA